MNLTWNNDIDSIHAPVTVVTPTYDRIDSLKNALSCVMKQTHENIEHIVVGDACPVLDGARAALLRINPKLKIHNLPGEGKPTYGPARIARVRNSGISLASGRFIAHLDDDNTWDENHIESLLRAFARRPDAAAAHSYRKLLIDGHTPYTHPYHPWSPDMETARHVYEAYERMGIYERNSHLMKDRVTFHEERDCTVDANELLVRHEIHDLYPFVEEFPESIIQRDLGEDDVFCEMIYRAGYRIVSSGEFTLNFQVGGRFTQQILSLLGGEDPG